MRQALSPLIMVIALVLGGCHRAAAYPETPAASSPAHPDIHLVQEQGVWWFQDGQGRKFFSLGVNCIGGCYGHAEETPLAPEAKGRILGLVKDWGFNTAAAWSSPSVWDELYVADQIYTGFVPDRTRRLR